MLAASIDRPPLPLTHRGGTQYIPRQDLSDPAANQVSRTIAILSIILVSPFLLGGILWSVGKSNGDTTLEFEGKTIVVAFGVAEGAFGLCGLCWLCCKCAKACLRK